MIVRATKEQADALAELASELWDGHPAAELREMYRDLTDREDAACFIDYRDGTPVGFAQCQLRHDYVEGTEASPVGYLEGIYVREGFRRQGSARRLLEACQSWAGDRGCSEFASDCELDNEDSLRFHLKTGFSVANRIVCFAKKL